MKVQVRFMDSSRDGVFDDAVGTSYDANFFTVEAQDRTYYRYPLRAVCSVVEVHTAEEDGDEL